MLEIIIEGPLKPVPHRLAAERSALFEMGIDPGEAVCTPGAASLSRRAWRSVSSRWSAGGRHPYPPARVRPKVQRPASIRNPGLPPRGIRPESCAPCPAAAPGLDEVQLLDDVGFAVFMDPTLRQPTRDAVLDEATKGIGLPGCIIVAQIKERFLPVAGDQEADVADLSAFAADLADEHDIGNGVHLANRRLHDLRVELREVIVIGHVVHAHETPEQVDLPPAVDPVRTKRKQFS